MQHVGGGPGALDYFPCRYNGSRVVFRGPRKTLRGPYIACLGSTETYGRFIPNPYPELLEQDLGLDCVNFGNINAGIDLYLNEPAIAGPIESAAVVVMQIMSAQNMSNRFYYVHPRRNDRFLRATDRLMTLFPEVDFTEFHFNRHLLLHLAELCPRRFDEIVSELQTAWAARMRSFLGRMRGRIVLLWLSPDPVPDTAQVASGADPLFVDRAMLDALRPRVTEIVEVTASAMARADGTEGMVFAEFETPAAGELLGPRAHQETATALVPVLERLLPDATG